MRAGSPAPPAFDGEQNTSNGPTVDHLLLQHNLDNLRHALANSKLSDYHSALVNINLMAVALYCLCGVSQQAMHHSQYAHILLD
jgi:hypothetical protein